VFLFTKKIYFFERYDENNLFAYLLINFRLNVCVIQRTATKKIFLNKNTTKKISMPYTKIFSAVGLSTILINGSRTGYSLMKSLDVRSFVKGITKPTPIISNNILISERIKI
jgi:hypothetical protein